MPDRGGLGNPHEEAFFYEGFRDYGQNEPWQKDVVYDPQDCAKAVTDPNRKKALQDFFCTFREELKNLVFISKRPAFVEPPFFSKPLVKTVRTNPAIGVGAVGTLVQREIDDRQRNVVVSVGIDTDNPTAYVTGLFQFFFALSRVGSTVGAINIPIFEDQGAPGVTIGQTRVIPGDTPHPYDLIQAGLAFQIKGPATLLFQVFNGAAVPVTFRSVVGMYQYWLPKADEFASADLQL